MAAPTAQVRRSTWYNRLAKIVILSLLVQLVMTPGASTGVARADNGEPPLPVTVVEPEVPVSAPEPAQPPPPIVAIPADAPLLAVSHGREPLLPRDGTPEPPMPPLGISVTFSVTPTQAQPGSLVTYTVSLRNPSTTPLRLELQAALPPSAHAASGLGQGQGWVHAAWARALTTTLVLPPRATLVRSFSTKLAGIPEGTGWSNCWS